MPPWLITAFHTWAKGRASCDFDPADASRAGKRPVRDFLFSKSVWVWKHSGNAVISISKATQGTRYISPQKKLVKIGQILHIYHPLPSFNRFFSLPFTVVHVSNTHIHTCDYESLTGQGTLECGIIIIIVTALRKIKQVSLKPWWTWGCCTSMRT